jgi:peptidyl-prolyl cis-trans isomerase A (cyclophilin A)
MAMSRRHRFLIPVVFVGFACDSPSAGTFPPEDPGLAAENEAAGDPHRGRFPLESALAGLEGDGDLRAILVTDAGEVHCRLLPDAAPLTVANFVGLARGLRPFREHDDGEWITAPYYDGLPFHRVEPEQFVQTGKRGSSKWPGFRLQDEIGIGTAMDRAGIMAMANDGTPNSGAAQFFVTLAPLRDLDGKYTLFGRCEDDWVVRDIASRVESGETVRLQRVSIERD